MGSFWLGSKHPHAHQSPDAHFDDDRVWLGSGHHSYKSADATYEDGEIWLGDRHTPSQSPDAHYEDGRVWLGESHNSYQSADATCEDGQVWLGDGHAAHQSPYAHYEGDEDGAAAAAFLLLLDGAENVPEQDEEEDEEAQDSSSSDDADDENSSAQESNSSDGGYSYSGSYTATHSSAPVSSSNDSVPGVVMALAALVIILAISDSCPQSSSSSYGLGGGTEAAYTAPTETAVTQPPPAIDPWSKAKPLNPTGEKSPSSNFSTFQTPMETGETANLPLLETDPTIPGATKFGTPSASGRYRLIIVCGEKSCDDIWLIDKSRAAMIPFPKLDSWELTGICWSPQETFALALWHKKDETAFTALHLDTLVMTVTPDNILERYQRYQHGDIGEPPEGTARSLPIVVFDFQSIQWENETTFVADGAVYKRRWGDTSKGPWNGIRVNSDKVKIRFAIPNLYHTDMVSHEDVEMPEYPPGNQ